MDETMTAQERRDVLRTIQLAAREMDQKAARAHSLVIKDQPINEQVFAMLVLHAEMNDALNKLQATAASESP